MEEPLLTRGFPSGLVISHMVAPSVPPDVMPDPEVAEVCSVGRYANV